MSEPERPFLPMSGELGGDFMSGMADSIRERGAREVPEREEGVGVDEEKKMKSMIFSLTKTLLTILIAAIAATIGAILTDYWLLVVEFSIVAGIAYGGAGYVFLLILSLYQELRRLRR
jgi:hypothetical protein